MASAQNMSWDENSLVFTLHALCWNYSIVHFKYLLLVCTNFHSFINYKTQIIFNRFHTLRLVPSNFPSLKYDMFFWYFLFINSWFTSSLSKWTVFVHWKIAQPNNTTTKTIKCRLITFLWLYLPFDGITEMLLLCSIKTFITPPYGMDLLCRSFIKFISFLLSLPFVD